MGRSRMLTAVALLTAGVSLSLGPGIVRPIHAYEPETHQEISDTAVPRSTLDRVLKEQYGTTEGIAFEISRDAVRNSVRQWIALGSNLEDVPPTRARNHFHDPLRPWPQAGGFLGQSSIYWQQNAAQGGGGTWSWGVARGGFFEFLTLPLKAEREAALADAARALGQVMHMIQDATSPAHARNDPQVRFDGHVNW